MIGNQSGLWLPPRRPEPTDHLLERKETILTMKDLGTAYASNSGSASNFLHFKQEGNAQMSHKKLW